MRACAAARFAEAVRAIHAFRRCAGRRSRGAFLRFAHRVSGRVDIRPVGARRARFVLFGFTPLRFAQFGFVLSPGGRPLRFFALPCRAAPPRSDLGVEGDLGADGRSDVATRGQGVVERLSRPPAAPWRPYDIVSPFRREPLQVGSRSRFRDGQIRRFGRAHDVDGRGARVLVRRTVVCLDDRPQRRDRLAFFAFACFSRSAVGAFGRCRLPAKGERRRDCGQRDGDSPPHGAEKLPGPVELCESSRNMTTAPRQGFGRISRRGG